MAAPLIEAHYTFAFLTKDVAGNPELQGEAYEFIRNGNQGILLADFPLRDLTNPDIRCNVGGEQAGTAKTFTAEAGTSLGFQFLSPSSQMHPGPAGVYMSKAPAAVSDYDGSGDWFKIHEESVKDDLSLLGAEAWTTFEKLGVNFTIPKDVPAGEYLIRVEHIGLQRVPTGEAEFYVSCAQIKVTGGGTGKPEPLVKIPGYLNADDPGLKYDMFSATRPDYRTIVPGPDVWPAPAPAKKSKSKRT
ncbi:hypothetical protein HYFRA_00012143, partial [Hymenoscyphus fraxineus]